MVGCDIVIHIEFRTSNQLSHTFTDMGNLKKKLRKQSRNPKEGTPPTPAPVVPSSQIVTQYRFERIFQADSIRKQIQLNVGKIFDEIPDFEKDLTEWTTTGVSKEGHCEVPSAGRTMEWKLHEDIRKYPEVWFRA
jgi:hypothetical protein